MSEPTQPGHQPPSTGGSTAGGGSTPPGYQQQYYPPPQDRYAGPTYGEPHRPTNTMAIVSLVASIVGLTMLPFIGSVIGVVTGHIARRQIAETGEEGSGFATAGLVIGYVGVALLVLIILAVILFFGFFAAAVGSAGSL